ncbi:MAG: sugar ABC transporter permease [Thermotogota bacterium]|nr:sugar ABC transporter permease [Thermotogota bacterium]
MKNRAWIFLLPALAFMAISAVIPLITVVNYSQNYIFAGSMPFNVGIENFVEVLQDSQFTDAVLKQFAFTFLVLIIQIPLGIIIALSMPKKGKWVPLNLVLLGIPLLIPYNVVGIIWRLFTQADIGVVPNFFNLMDYAYNVTMNSNDAFFTILTVDVWHWTPLIVLLVYAGLQAIPSAYYKAAAIDGASKWSTFKYVTLPKLRTVLTIGILLRFMDSFKIYSEPLLLTGGGPGTATTFLSLFVSRKAESYELGYASAASLIYFFIVLILSYIFFQFISRAGKGVHNA